MADATQTTGIHNSPAARKRLRRRYAREQGFRYLGLGAIVIALMMLVWLLVTIAGNGFSAFVRHEITLDVTLSEAQIDPAGTRNPAIIRAQNFQPLLLEAMVERFPNVRAESAQVEEELAAQNERIAELEARAGEARARQEALNAEILSLFAQPAAVDRVKSLVMSDPFQIGSYVDFDLPLSNAALQVMEGGEDSALTETQMALMAAFIRKDRLDLESDPPTAEIKVELPRTYLDPRETYDPEVLEASDFRTVLARSAAAHAIEVAVRYYALEGTQERAEAGQAAGEQYKQRLLDQFYAFEDEVVDILSVSGALKLLRDMVVSDPSLVGQTVSITVPTSDDVDMALKGYLRASDIGEGRVITARQLAWAQELKDSGEIERVFNTAFFTNADSQDAELAGIASALMGSVLALLVTMALAFPLAVLAAIYLEEFAPKNRLTDFIEVNINNLAAVPSIVFGLLGLAVFLNTFGLPRSAPLVGGMVLALMTLPTIIIATRSALKAVPPSIREGALGIGASPVQAVFHHVLPLALPGILTGSIIGMLQALGETAPLLMIGMIAFVTEVPTNVTEPATVLPVQVFLWAERPERGFVEKTSAAIICLLTLMFVMNLAAVLLRRRFERRW